MYIKKTIIPDRPNEIRSNSTTSSRSLDFLHRPQRVTHMNDYTFPEEEVKRNTAFNKNLHNKHSTTEDTDNDDTSESIIDEEGIIFKNNGERLRSSLKKHHNRSKSLPGNITIPKQRNMRRSCSVHFAKDIPLHYYSYDNKIEGKDTCTDIYSQHQSHISHMKQLAVEAKTRCDTEDNTNTNTNTNTSNNTVAAYKLVPMNFNIRPSSTPVCMYLQHPAIPANTAHCQLARISLHRPGILKLQILLENLAFAKHVSARFTLDGWDSAHETGGTWLGSRDLAWDVFSVAIPLPQARDVLREVGRSGIELEMCIHSTIGDDNDQWLNNNGENYKIRLVI